MSHDKYFQWYSYVRNPDEIFDRMMAQKDNIFFTRTVTMYDKKITVKRMSSIFANTKEIGETFYDMNVLDWDVCPDVKKLRDKLSKKFDVPFDYCLAHLYPDGNASIAWHNDKEALNTPVASISLGATRKFRLRELGYRVGWEYEIPLESGDLLWMTKKCQRKYEHHVPVEKKVTKPRINLTFRVME